MEKEINEILESKADKKKLHHSGKKTDKGEMLQLKEVLYSRMDDLQATANALGSSNGNPNAKLAYSSGGNVDSSEIVAMNERFDLLTDSSRICPGVTTVGISQRGRGGNERRIT